MKRLGKIMSMFICLLAVAICIMWVVMNIIDADGDISNIVWTKEALEAYNEAPEDFTVEYYKVYEDHFFTNETHNKGYFSVSKIRFLPAASQWQMTVRYNKSTLKYLSEDLNIKLEEGKDHFTFALEDSSGNMYTDFSYKKDVQGRYTYYRLIFDNVSIKNVSDVMIRIYLSDDIKDDVYPEEALGELPMYQADLPRDTYKFKKELPDDMKPESSLKTDDDLLK